MRELDERYALVRRIGRGGVGEVYEGIQVALDRRVAIKLLRAELTVRPEVVHRFEQEARTTCRLNHPNVVTVYDVGTAPDGGRFLVMELLEGSTLARRLRQSPMELEQALDVATQIVRGMGAGQGVGLVHRDLKPENIFLVDGHVKILDFGLALLHQGAAEPGQSPPERSLANSLERLVSGSLSQQSADTTWNEASLGDDSLSAAPLDALVADSTPSARGRLTSPGSLVGTPRYMAPEQALCWEVDHRTDLYAFGCIFYEMLAGRAPFEESSVQAYLQAHVHGTVPPLLEENPALSEPLAELVHSLLAKDPHARPSDWSAVAESLRRVLGEQRPKARATTDRGLPPPDEPYRFLQPFSAATGAIFFGRDQDTARFLRQWEHADRTSLLVVTGRSGVGKTSFLYARAIPSLEDLGHEVITLRGGEHPTADLQRAVARSLARESGESRDLALPEALDRLSQTRGRPLAVVLDQLEELFTLGDPAAHEAFATDLATVVAAGDRHVRFVLSVREDYLGALLRTLDRLPLDEVMRTLPLAPLGPRDIREALEGPSRAELNVDYAPFSFEDGLLAEIVRDLQTDDAGEVAPRIQAVGYRLWQMAEARGDRRITADDYRNRLGGARGILARVLDEAIADLSPEDQGPAKEMLRALTHLPGSASSRPTRQEALLRGHRDRERRRKILKRLESSWRVLQGYRDPRYPDDRFVRLAHEALIDRIREYGQELHERNRGRQMFEQGLALWLQGGRRDLDLLPESHFDVVLRHSEALVLRTSDEEQFFEASRALHNNAWWERQEDKRKREQRRTRRLFVAPAVLLLVGAMVGQLPYGLSGFRSLRAHALSWLGVDRANLSGIDLRLIDLQDAHLLAAELYDADLRGADLRGAELEQAQLQGADLRSADLRGATLRGANLTGARLDGADFSGADLHLAVLRAPLSQATWTFATFTSETEWQGEPPHGALGPWGNARDMDLSGRQMRGLIAPRIDLSEANLRETDLTQCSLNWATLDLVEAEGAVLRDCAMTGASLAHANLAGADLTRVILQEADLSGADLQGANLTNARLEEARLIGADLRDADLSGANLTRARLDHARLGGAVFDTDTKWPKDFTPP